MAATENTHLSRPLFAVVLFVSAMLLGLGAATFAPAASGFFDSVTDPLIIALVTLLFFDVRLDGAKHLLRAPGTVTLLMGMNFLLIPLLAWGLTALTVPGDDMLRLGVLIYLLFPCTDWFLGFIRVAGGNTVLGAALIPVNLTIQLVLYPLWVSVFTGRSLGSVLSELGPAMLAGVGVPLVVAGLARLFFWMRDAGEELGRVRRRNAYAVPWVIAAMILCLFAANGREYSVAPAAFGQVLLTVFLFFLISYVIIELLASCLKLSYENYSLFVVTASARNAPLMLAVTSLAFGDQPVLLAAIVLGMLLEFPHLTALTWLMRFKRERHSLAV